MSRVERQFLSHLAFRQAGQHSRPSWLMPRPRGCWQLVVWTMFGQYEASPFTKSGRILRRLETRGLISYGPTGTLPGRYGDQVGFTVLLTPAGYTAIGRAAPAHYEVLVRRASERRSIVHDERGKREHP